ncbi:MAG: hypothetical protein JSW47_20550, partial [Phycisphaerales bacterium]
ATDTTISKIIVVWQNRMVGLLSSFLAINNVLLWQTIIKGHPQIAISRSESRYIGSRRCFSSHFTNHNSFRDLIMENFVFA